MSTPCSQITTVGNSGCAAQNLALDVTTGNLSITDGNVVNLCSTVQLCETKTFLSDVQLIGSILQISYVGEDGVTQNKTVDLGAILSVTSLAVTDTNSIDLVWTAGVLRGNLLIDSTGTLPVSASPAGVKFDCCPETPITTNTTNTVQLVASGTESHTLTANLKFQDSQTIHLASSSAGIAASLLLSTDANNVATFGSDGRLYVAGLIPQLASLPLNGYVTTGTVGTLLVGSDGNLYRIPDFPGETAITGTNTNTVTLAISGLNSHTISANVNLNNSFSISLTSTVSGIQGNLLIDNSTPGNVAFTISSNGLVGNINCASVDGVMTGVATVANPVTRMYGKLNGGQCGYAPLTVTPYGVKAISMTTTQRINIPLADLYDTLTVFDSTIRAFFWYDAVSPAWVQLT